MNYIIRLRLMFFHPAILRVSILVGFPPGLNWVLMRLPFGPELIPQVMPFEPCVIRMPPIVNVLNQLI